MSPLTKQHRDLLHTVEECLNEVRSLPGNADPDQCDLAVQEMAAAAHALHETLEHDGIPVHHSQSMMKNRGVSPNTAGFYEHVHPVQDLIKIARAVP